MRRILSAFGAAGAAGILFVLVLSASGEPAGAFSGGITGRSGNPATGGTYCNACHAGGLTPVVSLEGPTQAEPGQTIIYTLRISGGQQIAGGLDVSATQGDLSVADPGTQKLGAEITHVEPRFADASGVVTFQFDWTAPLVTGPATLYAAGNSVNRNFSNSGDRAAATVLNIDVAETLVTPGEASGSGLPPLEVTGLDPATGNMTLTYGPACGATGHSLYFGPLAAVASYGWSGAVCGIGSSGSVASFNPGTGSYFFVIVARNSTKEGSYGLSFDGTTSTERPPFTGACGVVQDLTASCDAP
ncbi:MAG: choice-of-anchor V domain-containing protein [Candidatus Polarisedimenticolia bacterium]